MKRNEDRKSLGLSKKWIGHLGEFTKGTSTEGMPNTF